MKIVFTYTGCSVFFFFTFFTRKLTDALSLSTNTQLKLDSFALHYHFIGVFIKLQSKISVDIKTKVESRLNEGHFSL